MQPSRLQLSWWFGAAHGLGLCVVQEWTLPERNDERLEFPTNFARFQNVQTLVLFFPSNHGADETKLLFLGASCAPLPATRHGCWSLQPANCHIVPPPRLALMVVPLTDYFACMPSRISRHCDKQQTSSGRSRL